jgi:hypothetical protein
LFSIYYTLSTAVTHPPGRQDTLDGYMGMVQLHNQYKDRGFQVVGVPCNQFGGQEPNTNAVRAPEPQPEMHRVDPESGSTLRLL